MEGQEEARLFLSLEERREGDSCGRGSKATFVLRYVSL